MSVNFDAIISQWLRAHPDDRDPAQGALLLLRADRNQVFYRAALASPSTYLPEIETRLREYLRRRRATPTPSEALALAGEAGDIIASQDTPTPLGKDPQAIKSGLRTDHDNLPPDIQNLYIRNRELRAKMQIYHSRIRSLAATGCEQECSRQEIADLVSLLREADIEYHLNWQKYDNATTSPLHDPESSES